MNWLPLSAWITGAGALPPSTITYPANSGEAGLQEALQRINAEASQAIADGYSLVVLSDRAVGTDRIAMSALLAVGSVHHALVKKAERSQIGLIVETGEAREVHHHCLIDRLRCRRDQSVPCF